MRFRRHLERLEVVLLRGPEEDRLVVLVDVAVVRAAAQQHLDDGRVAERRRQQQRTEVVLVVDVDLRPAANREASVAV